MACQTIVMSPKTMASPRRAGAGPGFRNSGPELAATQTQNVRETDTKTWQQMNHDRQPGNSGSLSLWGAVSMGTGVMVGAGIFALTAQVAELAGPWFTLAFIGAAIVAGFSAYSHVKMLQHYTSAGGIAMFLKKAYGRSLKTGASAWRGVGVYRRKGFSAIASRR